MISLKTGEEIEMMREGGRKLSEIVRKLRLLFKEGNTTNKINQEAEGLIRASGGKPSFQTVKDYSWATCLSVNEQIVHTPPSDRKLKKGDLLTMDIGMFYKGFHTDFAVTEVIGETNGTKKHHFLKVGKRALHKAIRAARKTNRVGDISYTIEKEIYDNHFFIIKQLTGHGIGRQLHEEPFIPGFLDKPIEKTPILKPGLVIAIEVIYSFGTEHIAYEKDNPWSIITADGSISACFEHTIAITETGTRILTQ